MEALLYPGQEWTCALRKASPSPAPWNLILSRGTRHLKGQGSISTSVVDSHPDSTPWLPGASSVHSPGPVQPHVDVLSSDIIPIKLPCCLS